MSRCTLITYSDIEAAANCTFSATQRTALTSLIALIEARVAGSILDWEYEADGSHTYDGPGDRRLYLGRWLVSATSVTEDGDTVASTSYQNLNYMLKRYDGWGWSDLDYQNIVVSGVFGWETAEDADQEFKGHLLDVVMEMAPKFVAPEIQSESVGDVSVTYAVQQAVRSLAWQNMTIKYGGVQIA